MKESKFSAVSGVGKGKAKKEEKGKRSHFCIRIGLDFDPKTTRLCNQEDVNKHARYGVCLNPRIKVEFCPHDIDVSQARLIVVYICILRFWR